MAKSFKDITERFDFNRAAIAKQRIQNLRHAGGKVRGNRIANLLRTAGVREESEIDNELITQLDEVLSADAGADKWIQDFVHSTNPKFDGKSKKERINMALGAYYDTHKKKDGISEEQLDEKSDQAKQNKTMKNMMDASRGAKFKLNNPVPDAEPQHKTAQAHNKAIGRALRKEESMKSFTTVMKEQSIEEGRNEGDVPFDKPYKTVTSPVVKDKSGATHDPMSRARHIARMARDAQAKKMNPPQQQEGWDPERFGSDGSGAGGAGAGDISNKDKKKKVAKPLGEAKSTGPVNVDKVHAAGQEPHEEKWVPAKKVRKEEFDADGNVTYAPMTYNDFAMMLEYEADKSGKYVHKGSYGSEFAKAEREKDEKGFDAEPAKRGPKVGSKRGTRVNLGNSKLHKTI